MSKAVSLCVISIEVSDENVDGAPDSKGEAGECCAMAAKDSGRPKGRRGRRAMRDISIETHSRSGETPAPLLPRAADADAAADADGKTIWEDGKSSVTLIPSAATPAFAAEEASANGPTTTHKEGGSRRGRDKETLDSKSWDCKSDRDTSVIHFVSGNPFVEVTKGILHLYKENSLTPVDVASRLSQTVCLLAVPATMTCHDLLTFTAACHCYIQHLRILRDGTPNQYMVVITFRSEQATAEFYSTFNGAPYNSLEPEACCHVVFVSRVELVREDVPPPHHTELPTCPVCLERMDESVDGILTILCNHTFHTNCLAKWGDTSCPVCRYVQTPELVEDNCCFECHSDESLWICLICGHVGCGRYVQGHAFDHYIKTQHCYSMQLGSNRVWDYVGDNFVHRLLQNKGDGKLVEGTAPLKQELTDEKLDSVQLEFTYMLTSQLDSQRLYFEEQLNRLDQQTIAERNELKEKIQKLREENRSFEQKVTALSREKQSVDKKLQNLTARLTTSQSELQEERQLGAALAANEGNWQTKFKALEKQFQEYQKEKDKELSEMREQVRDVMFYLEAQKQIAESADREEIAEGRVTIGERPQNSSGRGALRRGRKHQ